MAEFSLKAEPFLGGYDASFGALRLSEVADLALVSVAVPLGGAEALDAACRAAWGLGLPAPGEAPRSADGAVRLLGLGADLFLAMLPEGVRVAQVAEKLGNTGWLTAQTDNWVALRLEGENAVAALERICPLDLHLSAFPEGKVARTVMEHLGTIVLREGPQRFLLLSASSSARSFLHALETSIRNVL